MSWLPKTSVVVPHDFSEQSDEADPEGNTFFDYTKQNPVPGGEARSAVIPIHDYHLPTVDTPHGRIAAAICFDMDFPRFIRQAARRAPT
jgi:apolipoprotein N-acyltransferase